MLPKLWISGGRFQRTEDRKEKRVSDQIQSFEDLKVYKRAYKLSIELHQLSLSMPVNEQYALADQIRRASKSICSNLAEGFSRRISSVKDFKRFIVMSLGSSDEMRVWLSYCKDLGYMDELTWKRFREEYTEISKMLQGLYKNWH